MNEILINNYNLGAFKFDYNYLDRFIEYTDVKEISLNTYKVCLKAFINWLEEHNIKEPIREDIKTYKKYLEIIGYKANTQNQYLRAVKHFFKWLASENLYPNIADNIKGAKVRHDNTKKEAFNDEDIRIIINSIDRTNEEGKRNYFMILLALTGGLRIIEIQRANIEDMMTIKGQLVLYIQGKGRDEKDEYIKIIEEVETAYNDYIETRNQRKKISPKDALIIGFGNRSAERLTEPSISRIIKNIFKKSGYDSNKLTAHSLRHTSNTLLFKSGASLFQVQRHARHVDPKTTEIYLHANERENDTSEKDIYNMIFTSHNKTLDEEITEVLKSLNEEEKKKALEILKSLKK